MAMCRGQFASDLCNDKRGVESGVALCLFICLVEVDRIELGSVSRDAPIRDLRRGVFSAFPVLEHRE